MLNDERCAATCDCSMHSMKQFIWFTMEIRDKRTIGGDRG